MKTKEKTIRGLAQEMSDAFEVKTRPDKSKFVCLKNGRPQWMTDLAKEVHGEKLPDDTIYQFISDAVDLIADAEEDQDIEDLIMEIEPDCYTSDLTAWLNKRNDHVYYITEALEEFGDFKDGFALLGIAQQIQKQEIARAVLEGLDKEVKR